MARISKLVNITPETKDAMISITRSRKAPLNHVNRAKVLIKLSDNIHPKTIALSLGISESTVRTLKAKAISLLVLEKFPVDQYLNDRPRAGRPPTILLEQQQHILKIACQKPSEQAINGLLGVLKTI